MESLPSRERGLKSGCTAACSVCPVSLPSRERGLKSTDKETELQAKIVAPLAGAWIEIFSDLNYVDQDKRRSPRGSVD